MIANYIKYLAGIVSVCLITATSSCLAEERIEMEAITVIGNKESPNQLYIVPWGSDGPGQMPEAEVSPKFFEEAVSPVDRNEMLRRLSRTDSK